MEKKTWRFYFTEDDYRQIRASRMTVALQSAFDFDLDKETNDPIDKYILDNTGLKLYDSELHDILIMKTYMVSKLEEVFDDLTNKQYTEDEIKEVYQKSFVDIFENVITDFYINDNAASYYEIVEPILSASMDHSDENSKEIVDSIEETINKAQEDSLPKIVIPDELKNEEKEDELKEEKEEIKEEQQEETEKEEIEEKPTIVKDEPIDEKDDKDDEGSSSIKVEM